MTLIQKFNNFLKKKLNNENLIILNRLKIQKFGSFYLLILFTSISLTFFITLNLINKNNLENKKNFDDVTKSSEFSNLANYFISKINSPYQEINYTIQSNDPVEKILKNHSVYKEEVKSISLKLKQKKLTNIYKGRKLKLILKKTQEGFKSVVNISYPLNNTTSIEVRKYKNDFIVKENILKLYKKEVVVKSIISSNLYSSATSKKIEPNIIIEFARIFGFEVDFQRDIRKGDWFEIFYEKFEDDNGKVRDTGKIIYASMFVTGEKIFIILMKNDEEYYDIKGRVLQITETPINGARLSSSFGMKNIQY